MKKITEKLAASDNDRWKNPPVTIAFLGDSVTQGCFEIYKTGDSSVQTVFDSGSSYSEKVKKLLRTVFPRAQINVVNAGISGDSAPSGLSRLDRDVLSFSPDVLVVCYGLNDVTRGEGHIGDYVRSLCEIFARAKQKGAEVIFMTPNMVNTRVKYNTEKMLMEWEGNTERLQNGGVMDKYMDAARDAAKECGVKVCDCYKKWKTLAAAGADTTELLANAINHPTRDMHWLFAYSLFEEIVFGE